MLRQIVLVSAFVHSAVFGAPQLLENPLERRLARRRSEDTDSNLEEHRVSVWSIAVYAGFRFKKCARSLPAWDTTSEQNDIRRFAGVIQGIFVNLEARRRFGFNVDHFLNNVVAKLSNDCDDGETAVVNECNQRAQLLMNLNLGHALAEFMTNFNNLSDGTDGLIECSLAEIPQVCADFYEELCVSD